MGGRWRSRAREFKRRRVPSAWQLGSLQSDDVLMRLGRNRHEYLEGRSRLVVRCSFCIAGRFVAVLGAVTVVMFTVAAAVSPVNARRRVGQRGPGLHSLAS